MNTYFKNFILCGEIDYHCLLCQESFKNLESVDKHLKWEKHRKLVKNQVYMLRKEFIYKVRDDYYCEICNKVMMNASKHKELTSHINIKKNPEIAVKKKSFAITRNPDETFTIDNFKMDVLHWHGIKNDYCTLCKRSIKDIVIHINLNVHLIKLIGCETKRFGDYYYRQISESILYCFLCSEVFPTTSLEIHWTRECDVTFKSKVILNETDRTLLKNDPGLAKALFEIQKLFFVIDTANNKAKCEQCHQTIKAKLDDMLHHRKKHLSAENGESIDSESKDSYEVTYAEVIDHGKRRHELAVYGRENFIKLNRGGSWAFCSICDLSISGHMKQVMDHVQGLRHRGFLELVGAKKARNRRDPPYPKQKMTAFLSNIYRVEHTKMYYVKDHMPVTEMSFMIMKEIGKPNTKVKCYACDVTVDAKVASEHMKTKAHKEKVLSCPMLVLDDGLELIRIIRPNLYHCAICNAILPYWETVERHVMKMPHTFNKTQKYLECDEAYDLREKYFGYRPKRENLTLQLKRLALL